MYYSLNNDSKVPVKKLGFNPLSGKLEEVKVSQLFLKGPIPIDWISVAAELPGKTLALGMAIWWLKGMSKTPTFKLTAKALSKFNISRDAASAGLTRLEKSGLISVSRSPGRRSVVGVNEVLKSDSRC